MISNAELKPEIHTNPRRSWRRWTIALLLLAVIGMNAVAFVQAWSMTHFVNGDSRTAPPEQLSVAGKIRVVLTGVHVPRPVNVLSPTDFGLRFQTGHVKSDGFDLETWTIPADGKSRGLVMMYHAYVASKSSLLPAARQFHQMGFAVELVDFRGSGGSTGNATTIGYYEADDVAATVADARKNPRANDQPLILYGQSMGAAAVLRAAGDLGVLADAIIIESPYDRLLSTAGNRFHAMHLPAFPLARLLIFWGGIQQGYWGFVMNPVDSAQHVFCPVLMFHGVLDARVTTEEAKNVFRHLGGTKRLEWYANAGHVSFLSSDPNRWSASVADFLQANIRK